MPFMLQIRFFVLVIASLSAIGIVAAQDVNNASQSTSAQSTSESAASEQRVSIKEDPVALDAMGRIALSAHLVTDELNATLDTPIKNVRFIVRNRSSFFYTYASGWVTFYGADGVRCGEGLFTLPAFASDEVVETDAPGLRLTCRPANWRIVAVNLLTRLTDLAKPEDATQKRERTITPPLTININGETFPVQVNNPLEIKVGQEKIKIIVSTEQQR
jgi:hypothetical protein